MVYDEGEGSGNKRSRGRQPVKRMGDRQPEHRRYREPGHTQPELTLITDTFRDGGGHRQSHSAKQSKQDSRRLGHGAKPQQDSRGTSRSRGDGPSQNERGRKRVPQDSGGIYSSPAKKRAKKRKRKIIIILFEVVILLSVIAFAAYSYVDKRLGDMSRLQWDPDEIKNIEISEEKQEQMKGYWTIAVFGVDSRNSSVGKGNNSDVIMICNINMDSGEIKLLSVYRDTYLNISDKNSYNKINAAYLQGGPEQAVKALNKNLDLDIDDYATFNWKSVADAINILGGIDMEISKRELYYMNAFITETVKATGVYSEHLKKSGMNHLDGVQAVAYGRLRLMDNDYARTERQRKVIALSFEKFKKADWSTINNVIQVIYRQVTTSVELGDLISVGRTIPKFHISETAGFPSARGEAKLGKKGDCVIPQTLEKNVIEIHRFLFGDENYVPTDTVRAISKKIISDTGLAKEAKPIGDVGTGGGTIPKSTAADEPEETKERESSWNQYDETTEGESGTHGYGESSAYPGIRPGEQETDSQGNMILPSRENSTGSYEPTQGETGSSVPRPGSTEEYTWPGTGGANGYNPGTGNGNNGNSNVPGGGNTLGGTSGGSPNAPGGGTSGNGTSGGSNAPGGSSGQNQPPGLNTDTGLILPPGTGGSNLNGGGNNNAPGYGGTGNGRVDYSGPTGY